MSDTKPQQKRLSRIARHRRVRAKVSGTSDRPRLAVFRSNKHISGQVINDLVGKTLVAVTEHEIDAKTRVSLTKGDERKGKTAIAHALGKMLAEKAKSAGIKAVVFDRGGFAYRGRVAAFADGAREGGLEL